MRARARALITEDDVAGEIGKVICGELEGRQSDDQVTVFDSTGIALQDSATVPLEYERAVAAGRRRREEDDQHLAAGTVVNLARAGARSLLGGCLCRCLGRRCFRGRRPS